MRLTGVPRTESALRRAAARAAPRGVGRGEAGLEDRRARTSDRARTRDRLSMDVPHMNGLPKQQPVAHQT